MHQPSLLTNTDGTQRHDATNVAEVVNTAAGAGVSYGPGSVFAVPLLGRGDGADVPDLELVVSDCG